MRSSIARSPAPAQATEARPPSPLPAPTWVAIAAVVLLDLLPNHAYNHDGIAYAEAVLNRGWGTWGNPHHLGYIPAMAALYRFARLLGYGGGPLPLMAGVSRLAAIGSTIFVARIFQRLGFPIVWVTFAVLLFGFGFTTWAFATVPAVYLPALVGFLGYYLELLSWSETGPTHRGLARAGAWLLVGTLCHQIGVLLLPAGIFWALRTTRQERKLSMGLRIALILGAPIALVYGLAYFLLGRCLDGESLPHWLTRYGHMSRYWIWNQLGPQSNGMRFWLVRFWGSHVKLFWPLPAGETYAPLTSDPLALTIQRHWPLAGFMALGGVLAIAILVAMWAGHHLWHRVARYRETTLLNIWWTVPLLALTTGFEPQNAFYRLFYFVPLVYLLLAPLALAELPRMQRHALIGVATLLVGSGLLLYAFALEPRAHPEVNPWEMGLTKLAALPPDPLVYITPRKPLHFLEPCYAMLELDRPIYLGALLSESQLREELEGRGVTVAQGLALGDRALSETPDSQVLLEQDILSAWRTLHACGMPADSKRFLLTYHLPEHRREVPSYVLDLTRLEPIGGLLDGGLTEFVRFRSTPKNPVSIGPSTP